MATKTIRIGSAENIVQYDDADYDSGIEIDAPMKADTPVDPNDVIRLEDVDGRFLGPLSVVNIANPTELNSMAGVPGVSILVFQIVGAGGLNIVTLYAYDASGPAVNAPYIMDADGAGSERWIAVVGRYAVQGLSLLGNIALTGTVDGVDLAAFSAAYIAHIANVNAHHAQVHAGGHVTGGGDVIANAIAAGNAGLMSGVDKTKLDGIETLADVTDLANVNVALGGLAGIANNDLIRWNDPGSTWEAKDIAEIIAGQNINPGAIRLALTIYANNAAAVAGGLVAGDFYRNGADPDLVCVVH